MSHHFSDIQQRIRGVAGLYGDDAIARHDVTLVAVSKMQPDDRVDAVLAAGQRVFGENRVQEAQGRWAVRRAQVAGLQLHLIGPLQTNKVKDALDLFDVIETLDRTSLADALAAAIAAGAPPREFFIQVNTGNEPQKSGASIADLPQLLKHALALGLNVTGLMCIPPQDEPAGLHFALLKKLARTYGLKKLSMGMSDDFERAIALGATHIRLGRAVFGDRVVV